MDQNESENNEVQTKTSDAQNPSKAEESLIQSRPREKQKTLILVKELLGLNQVNSQNSNAISRSTRSTSNKRTHTEKIETLFSKKNKVF